MAEFKLICPGCRAEYALPPDAIPQGGREVECPACGSTEVSKRLMSLSSEVSGGSEEGSTTGLHSRLRRTRQHGGSQDGGEIS